MARPLDAIGNKLYEGDLVRIHLDRPEVIGKITKIEGGEIFAPGAGADPNQNLPPIKIIIHVECGQKVHPLQPNAYNLLKLVIPPKAAAGESQGEA